ncbi:MAG: phosphate ABC transporter substrate-binding protein PstS [Gemmatimonadetes bacterium]|nr:phosphate ABC transporter substrate-binding protein PstS [Gemmatimonadota bacterium]
MRFVRAAAATLLAAIAAAAPAAAQDLTGAGATFPNPIYSKWFNDYAAKTGVKINYQSIGSGGGKRQISEMTVDFGASDGPMANEEMAKAKGGALLHIPTVMGGDVVVYNVPGVKGKLKFTGDVLADIFLGKITKWNDPRLVALNKGEALPAQDILVVHRSDGSGTTYIWTDYLSAVSPSWAAGPGKGTDVKWPVGLGGKGNEGVAGQVQQLPGSIGYVELIYALQNKIAFGLVKNAAGNFVDASTATITNAAAGIAKGLPANTDFRISIVNAPGKDAYPISSMTWLLVYQKSANAAKGKKLVDFLNWMLVDGQKSAASLDYAPLPPAIVKQIKAKVATISVK